MSRNMDIAGIRDELDRKVFYLQTLLDTSRELSGLIQPARILDTFLLMVMGPLGIVQGMGALINTATRQVHLTGRGLSASALAEVNGNIPGICDRYFPGEETPAFSVPRIKVITRESLADHGFYPPQMQILILWDLSGEYSGFLGLGERITGDLFGDDEINILLNLTNILTNALSHALSFWNTQQLNADLLKKNDELQESLNEAREAREQLDKRVFRLRALSSLNSELRSITDVQELLNHFLLLAMGSLGINQGFLLVYDREKETGRIVSRGITRERELDSRDCEKLLYNALDAVEEKSLSPMSIGRLTAPGPFWEAGVDIDVKSGFFFVIDHQFMGVAAFGPAISGFAFTAEELDFLSTQVSNLMAYLKNAKAFGTIKALIEDLTHRNEDLRQTITELTEAKQKISILEKTKAHFKAVLQKQAERINRASSLDFMLIFFLAAAVGVLFNLANPQGISLLPPSVIQSAFDSVSVQEAQRLVEEKKALLVDARPKEFYSREHIEGAVSVPLSLFDVIYMMKLSNTDLETPIIVYGRTISRLYDVEVAHLLKKRDHEKVYVLSGGMDAWKEQGRQVTK